MNILELKDINKNFHYNKGIMKKSFSVLKDIFLNIISNETYGLVGESGSGKSTLARVILNLTPKQSGEIIFKGNKISMVFQNPLKSFDPRMSILNSMKEALYLNNIKDEELIYNWTNAVGIEKYSLKKRPKEFSGGECQRLAIARSYILDPDLLVLDEPTSALDQSVQAKLLNLMKEMKDKKNTSYLFITHNLSVIRYMADRIGVLYLGNLIEEGKTKELFNNPLHPYTRMLIQSMPENRNMNVTIKGEIPSPINPPGGCPFHPRCPEAMDVCTLNQPKEITIDNRRVICHLYT